MQRTLEPNRLPHRGKPPRYPVGQTHILEACLAFRFVTCIFGRSWGKTAVALFLVLTEGATAWLAGQVYSVAYCAPTYKLAKPTYLQWKHALGPLVKSHNDADLTLVLWPWGGNAGCEIVFWGLDAYDNLRGPRRHRIIVDECATVVEEAVFRVLWWMAAGRDGRFLFIGTPSRKGQGSHWFLREFDKGMDQEAYPDHASFTAPTQGNPTLSDSDIATLIQGCTDEKAIREEIYAERIPGEGAVFERVNETCSLPVWRTFRIDIDASGKVRWTRGHERPNLWLGEKPDEGAIDRNLDAYGAGLDLGVVGDFTVSTGFNRRTRNQAWLMRLGGLPYMQQTPIIDAVYRLFRRPLTAYDLTGGHGGEVTDEMVRRYGDSFVGRTWDVHTKEGDIAAAQNLFSQSGSPSGWRLLEVPWQKAEFLNYQVETRGKDGRNLHHARFGAPAQMHDDSVSAACLVADLVRIPWAARALPAKADLWQPGENGEVRIPASWIKQQARRAERQERLRSWTRG